MQEPTTEIQFPQYILKNLLDKNEQKRDSACKQLEIIAKKSALKKNFAQIQKFITFFKDKYISANDFNKKKAGLEALTSITFGIKVNSQAVDKLAGIIVDIILETLNQQEHKVRYTALKSLYFICQSLEQKILKMFNRIFESIIGKMTDLDQQTRNAARFLDSALQTALNSALLNSQNQQMFNIKQFMGILKSKFKSMNPAIRQFLIRWINVLNEIVSVDLLQYLPDLLEDLLFMLGDKEKTLKVSAQECLKNFEKQMAEKFIEGKLESIISLGTIDQILSILIKVAKGKSHVNSKITTLNYLKLLISFFKSQLDPKAKLANNKNFFKKVILDRFDQVLEPILLLMSYEEEQVRKISFQTNQMLMVAIQMINKEEPINFSKVMPLLKTMLSEKRSTSTSESALKWMKFMLQNYNDKILPQINDIIERLVQKLCDPSGKNVIQIIENTTVTEQYFERLIEKMLMLLMNKSQTDDKPEHILKRFSSILEPDKFCKTLAAQVIQTFSEDYQFIFEIVQYLTQLIITEKNMQKVRKKLQNKKDIQFFHTLFKAFSYNPAAATCLCLLAQQFQLAYKIVTTLGNQVQITQGVLTGFCKVTTMIQSPGFLFLRLQMLNRREHPYLIETLCAILMILPQGKISNILKNRLEISKITIDSKVIEQKQKKGSMKKSLMEEGNLSLSGIQKLLTDYLQIQKKFAAVNSK